jgi:beta-lactamase regulating signal transducer with metallopeptidase domain
MTNTLQAIAWTLIHFCWQAAAIAALYRVTTVVIARRSSQTRYLAALVTLLVMVGASLFTLAWELRFTAEYSPTSALVAAGMQGTMADPELPHIMRPGFIASHNQSLGVTSANLLPWIDGLWVIGVVALSLRSLGGWGVIQRLRTSATVEAPQQVQASFLRISAALGLRRPALLRISDHLSGPVTVGAFRAMVLLPLSAVTLLGPEELEVVLAHELAHVRRADFFWNLVQTMAETLFFFHPAVWWIGGRIRHERELCCDDLALRVCPNPVVYASALFRLEEQRSRQWRMVMALDGQSPQTLRMRIARILDEPGAQSSGRRQEPSSLIAACAALIVLLLPTPQVLASFHAAHLPSKVSSANVGGLKAVGAAAHNPATEVLHASAMAPLLLAQESQDNAPAVNDSASPQGAQKTGDSGQSKSSYIERMKAAGYDVDLDKYIAMKVQNITPEYARSMAQAGFGKPSADELIACKIQGVTPEVITQLKQQGMEIGGFQDAISFRIFQVTPEFVAGMKAAGFDHLKSQSLLAMRVQGVTPEYARSMKQQFPGVTADDLIKARIFHIDSDFVASAKSHGFNNLSFEKLVQLRISGLLDEESK